MWCYSVFYARQFWNVSAVVRSQENTCSTTKRRSWNPCALEETCYDVTSIGTKFTMYYLITCVKAQSNPHRLLPIWREKLRGHYHVTMTSDNDFCVWRWHYRERHSRISVNAQTIARNAPRIRALITSHNDRHVWTDWNSFTGMSTEMI